MVLCRGRIVERGPTDSIINNPAHPYTRMLLNSIPIPDPERRWRERIIPKVITGPSRHARGCVFYDNCRFRKERCLKEEPYLVEIEHNHEVACYLYT
ncbi:MAG: hypothetical protein DRJ43_02605 [Thermoprotei archaeon]|nr:MAG: hypothetical protein DRJ43_02605 [Thermoprotei archaeon]